MTFSGKSRWLELLRCSYTPKKSVQSLLEQFPLWVSTFSNRNGFHIAALNVPGITVGKISSNVCFMPNTQIHCGLRPTGRLVCRVCPSCTFQHRSRSMFHAEQCQTQRSLLPTCPKQFIYAYSPTNAPAKLAALIISALSLQAFRAILNINFASLQVCQGFYFAKLPKLAVKLSDLGHYPNSLSICGFKIKE